MIDPPDPERSPELDPEVLALLEPWNVEVAETDEEGVARPGGPSRVASWSRSSLLGAVMTGYALGLREILDPPTDEQIVIEVDASGEPHDLPIRLLLDPDSPQGSLCIVRRDPPPPVV
ncbi:MAG: hypothetical protein R2711_06225 [Acidimicrobiales bacterium]